MHFRNQCWVLHLGSQSPQSTVLGGQGGAQRVGLGDLPQSDLGQCFAVTASWDAVWPVVLCGGHVGSRGAGNCGTSHPSPCAEVHRESPGKVSRGAFSELI